MDEIDTLIASMDEIDTLTASMDADCNDNRLRRARLLPRATAIRDLQPLHRRSLAREIHDHEARGDPNQLF